ncbi:uroporphyrinogen-III synthase [Campylobacter hepaticus]|uniref:Uroporphyrinogen-III synthase n=1 Tax=Campylobacter hepaticus TaxID=1813019 RepID=A0A6A7JRH4_9BACT|nr:uroporphyrinogen-III synthase [Campylobacter hepaticus]AXP08433.1 uroporphyrinogen-III synthase [Campylobacter hepaticus]MCZ0772264.1 uroporphyrinogen-III synthase [Campylobacter hepaticus]MCZ0773732.1 uroporphyrinogen-III synthase [Campylobacter hepaticus]MCZ0774983.1 uroporphyrinogen-III synthase [Campylobacter hepaticus]MDX2322851.1 uroporphyrinogen-III synthase [Campylobacter hepaticus]
MKIYLLNETPFEGVENLILNELIFYDFNVDLSKYEVLIYTSKNALKALKKANIKLNFELDLYAVGQKSAEFAKQMGFKKVKFPKKANAKELFFEFQKEFSGKKCLYLRGKNIISTLHWDLKNLGINIEQKIVYENIFKKANILLIQPAIFIFTSPLSVDNFLQFYTLNSHDKIIAIGQSTAKRLLNFNNVLICEKQSLQECVKLAKTLI